MKLTDSQRSSLYGLRLGVCRPDNNTPALLRHGLAVGGKSRYGDWVQITDAGMLEARKWSVDDNKRFCREGTFEFNVEENKERKTKPQDFVYASQSIHPVSGAGPDPAGAGEGQLLRGAAPRNHRIAAKQAEALAGAGTPSRTRLPATPLASGATQSKSKPVQPQASAPQSRSTTARREASKAGNGIERTSTTAPSSTPSKRPHTSKTPPVKTGAVTPNACRVLTGNKYAYYPLTSFDTLKGDKARVRTLNRIFKSVKVKDGQGDIVCA